MKTEQVLNICKQVEDKVGTLATITDLKKCLEECDVDYFTQDEWEELVSYLERYYIILKSTFDADDSTVSFRFLFFDSADTVIGYSELLSIDNSGESAGGGRYYGIPIVFANVFCAKNFQIKLIDITGDVTIYAGVC
jgi:hypothetical protein